MNIISERLMSYRAFLVHEKEKLTRQIAELESQGRQDEANLTKIRLNIFGVFETVAAVDEKAAASWEDFCLRYEPRFDTLTAPWSARLQNAVRNSDSFTRFTEEIKLSTAQQIHTEFLSVKE